MSKSTPRRIQCPNQEFSDEVLEIRDKYLKNTANFQTRVLINRFEGRILRFIEKTYG